MSLKDTKNHLFPNDGTPSFFRNVATLAFGAGSAKVIGLMATPVLTRIYTPSDFGVLSVFTALVAVLMPMVTLRYVMAIPLPRSDRLAINILAVCLLLMVISTVALTLVLWVVGPWLLPVLSMEGLLPYWWLIGLAILCSSLYELLTLWATRKRAFKILARAEVWQVSLGTTVKIGLGFLVVTSLGLLIGQVIQQSAGIFSLTNHFRLSLVGLWPDVTIDRMRLILRRYADLPKFRLPSQLLLVFATQAPLLFSAILFGSEITGQLGLALIALALPIQLFGNATGKAYFAEISHLGRFQPKKILELTKDVTKLMLLLSFVPCSVLLFGGRLLFSLVFGEEWERAGQFASMLSVYLLAQFLTAPLVNVFTVFENQKTFFVINLIRALIVAIVFLSAFALGLDENISVLIYSLFMTMHYFFVYVKVYRFLQSKI